jgi:hypothetical protein
MPAKNPFPGMNPYLERHWGDIHARLVLYACDQLNEQLPDPLRARVEERVYLESPSGPAGVAVPDVRVIEKRPHARPSQSTGPQDGGVALAEPLVIELPHERITETFIEIRNPSSPARVITMIEILSLANKTTASGGEEYRKKQQELLASHTSLVEIDLLRKGRHSTALPLDFIPPDRRAPYHAVIHRASRPRAFEYYAMPLRQRLSKIAIPLRDSDQDAQLDLQALVDQAYRLGRYDDLDYAREPDPPLPPDDAQWARSLLSR